MAFLLSSCARLFFLSKRVAISIESSPGYFFISSLPKILETYEKKTFKAVFDES